jgi:hypothetical protein
MSKHQHVTVVSKVCVLIRYYNYIASTEGSQIYVKLVHWKQGFAIWGSGQTTHSMYYRVKYKVK